MENEKYLSEALLIILHSPDKALLIGGFESLRPPVCR